MISYHKIYMSPVQSSNLQSQLCALWKKQRFCDAVIKSDNISVMAHRLVLAASCPMLQSMENYSFGSLLEIRVESDMTKESVMAFLQYLYEGYLMLTEENYSHVEKLARSMHIDSIISCCKDFSQSILSSRSHIHGPTDQADLKHVRITNLLKVLDSSQKRPHESSDSDFSKRLKQSSSDHCSSESITVKQESPLGATQSESGRRGGTELRQGPSACDQSESYLTPSNMVSLNINSVKPAASGDGKTFFSNAKFKEGRSTSLNSIGPHPVQTSGRSGQLNGCPLTPTISNVYSLQTVQSSNFELGKKTPQAEPYPVLLKEVRQSSSPFSCNSAEVGASCVGFDKDDKQPISSQSSSIQQQQIQLKESSRKLREKSISQTHTSTSNSATSSDPSAEVSLSIVKVEPEDGIIQTDEGMFLSTAQRDETQTSQSSWLHDNPSMSSEENSGQEEMSSSLTSRTDFDNVLSRITVSDIDTSHQVFDDQTSQNMPTTIRFHKLSEEEIQGIQDFPQSKATKKNTKWGIKILTDWHTETFGVPLDMTTVEEEELAKKLGRFYCEAKPQPDQKYGKHTEYHINTMKSIRAAINRHFSDIGRNINIVNDKAFKVANKGLTGLLKRRMVTGTFRPTTHKEIIDISDLQKITAFFENAYLSPINLRLAAWYIIAVNFVSKGLGFYYQLRKDSFDFKADEEGSTYACLKRKQKSKDYLDYNHITEAMYDKRIYETGNRNCPVKTLKFFLAKTDPNASYLFNKCLKDAICSPNICNLWYSNKHLNQGSFVSFLPDICKAADCKRYTANCLRETAIQAGFEPRDIMYFSGHEYNTSMHSYDREISKSASATLYSMAGNVVGIENDNVDGSYESM